MCLCASFVMILNAVIVHTLAASQSLFCIPTESEETDIFVYLKGWLALFVCISPTAAWEHPLWPSLEGCRDAAPCSWMIVDTLRSTTARTRAQHCLQEDKVLLRSLLLFLHSKTTRLIHLTLKQTPFSSSRVCLQTPLQSSWSTHLSLTKSCGNHCILNGFGLCLFPGCILWL